MNEEGRRRKEKKKQAPPPFITCCIHPPWRIKWLIQITPPSLLTLGKVKGLKSLNF
jgi:hypothetical protein